MQHFIYLFMFALRTIALIPPLQPKCQMHKICQSAMGINIYTYIPYCTYTNISLFNFILYAFHCWWLFFHGYSWLLPGFCPFWCPNDDVSQFWVIWGPCTCRYMYIYIFYSSFPTCRGVLPSSGMTLRNHFNEPKLLALNRKKRKNEGKNTGCTCPVDRAEVAISR